MSTSYIAINPVNPLLPNPPRKVLIDGNPIQNIPKSIFNTPRNVLAEVKVYLQSI